ncbi:MAG: AAA family ATPase, partial [Candidatus Obscuribacterales bacterium]|nr:AAA family ATPase [Candidatus Obscuribacterales bacterium]
MPPNSRHSVGFHRLFDAVINNVIQPLLDRLWDTRVLGDEFPDAKKQLALDMTHIAATLDYKKHGLSREQYAFLGDLTDFVLKKENNDSIDDHKNRIKRLVENHYYWDPPTDSLNLLRGYDAVKKTSIAKMYKDLLMKIVSVTLTHVEHPTPKDNEILQEFDLFWTEVVTATRTQQKRLRAESSPLISELNKAVQEFAVPASEVIKSVEQLAQMEGLKDTEGFIRKSFTNYCAQAILVDSVVDQRELELFHDLAPTLMFYGHQGSLHNLREIFKGASKNMGPDETPLLVSILDLYDQSMNTDLGDRARSLYFRLANTAFKSDSNVAPEEFAWLEQFKKTLYPHGTSVNLEEAPAPPPSQQTTQKTVVGSMTVEQSLEQLNLFIGLDRAKQDIAQLVSFVKVQQMRAEKGLPGSTITRHLMLYGNPGTGRTSVARILANIYRALGVIKRGHVVEIDRTGLKTAAKAREAVSSARYGVLLINEPYELVSDGGQSAFGQEQIDAFVKAMQDHRDALVVLMAGSEDKISKFVNSNAGLKLRFQKAIHFDDYTPTQMLDIFQSFCKRARFRVTPAALEQVRVLFDELHASGQIGGTARDVRSLFDS